MKRKVLISVLAIALVLTLCLGIFAACDPKEDDTSKKTEYTVTYSLGEYDGTSAAPAAQKVEDGSKATLPEVGVTWEGHNFTGWKAGEGELLQPGAQVEVKADITYIAQWEETSETPETPKVTIYYTLGTELKSVVVNAMEAEEDGKYYLNTPSDYVPSDEWNDFMEQLGKAEKYGYYYYDETAADHKGKEFIYNPFEAEADFAIIIIKEAIGTPATAIDESWYGVYVGQSMFGQPYRLTISDKDGGTIKLDDSMEGALGQIPAENIYNTADGKLVLAKRDEWSGGYIYYYFTKNSDGSITLESDEASLQLAQAQEINVKVYYPIDAQGTLRTIDVKGYKIGETCSLDDSPERPIVDDWTAFEAQGGYDKEMAYYFYNEADQTKGDEFNWREFEADGDIAIIIEFTKFADKLESIDAKYNGTFSGTSEAMEDTFVLTISSADGTATFEYANEINSFFNFKASVDDGSILTKDGKLVFAKGNKLYPTYFYLSEKDGAYTLDTNDENGIALTKAPTFDEIIGGYKSANESYIYLSKELADDTYLGSFLYGGELMPIYAFTVAADGKSYTLYGEHSDYSDFSATYKSADKSITIGTDAYTLDAEAPKASNADFRGYWERSDTKQYFALEAGSDPKIGKDDPKTAYFNIIGTYFYMSYEQANNTYYYLLQAHTEDETKTLVGTFVAPEKAPQQVTFNATEKYEAPAELQFSYTGEVTLTVGEHTIKLTSLALSSLETAEFAEATLSFDGAAEAKYEVSSGLSYRDIKGAPYVEGRSYYFKITISETDVKIAYVISEDQKSLTIYNYDTDILAGTLTDGTGGGIQEPDEPTFEEYNGTFTIEYSLIPTGKGQMTISKFLISSDYKTVKITVTVGGKESELTSDSVDDQTDWYNRQEVETEAVKQLDLQFTYEKLGVPFSIVIFADHSLNIIDDTPQNLAPLEGHETEKNLFTTSEYVEPQEPAEEEVSITVTAGENCANADWTKAITIKTGSHSISEITALIGESDLPAGANRYWYFAGYIIDGKSYAKTSSDKVTISKTSTIALNYKDDTWECENDDYYKLFATNFGSATGTIEFRDEFNGKIATYNYSYDLSKNTITLTNGEEKYEGTLTEKVELATRLYTSNYFEINITLPYKDFTVTFGTGSPSTGGGYPDR